MFDVINPTFYVNCLCCSVIATATSSNEQDRENITQSWPWEIRRLLIFSNTFGRLSLSLTDCHNKRNFFSRSCAATTRGQGKL